MVAAKVATATTYSRCKDSQYYISNRMAKFIVTTRPVKHQKSPSVGPENFKEIASMPPIRVVFLPLVIRSVSTHDLDALVKILTVP